MLMWDVLSSNGELRSSFLPHVPDIGSRVTLGGGSVRDLSGLNNALQVRENFRVSAAYAAAFNSVPND